MGVLGVTIDPVFERIVPVTNRCCCFAFEICCRRLKPHEHDDAGTSQLRVLSLSDLVLKECQFDGKLVMSNGICSFPPHKSAKHRDTVVVHPNLASMPPTMALQYLIHCHSGCRSALWHRDVFVADSGRNTNIYQFLTYYPHFELLLLLMVARLSVFLEIQCLIHSETSLPGNFPQNCGVQIDYYNELFPCFVILKRAFSFY